MRAALWAGTGYISGTSFNVSSTTSGSTSNLVVGSRISGFGTAVETVVTAVVTAGSQYTINKSQTVGSSGSPASLSGSNPSTPTQAQFTMSFFGDPKGAGAQPLPGYSTCQIDPTFNDTTALMVGSGQGMRLSDIAIVGPNNAYRGNFNPGGVGIGIAGGSGGASGTLIRDTFVRYFYALYMTDANYGCCLADSNDFDHVGGFDGYYGIHLYGTQSFINNISEPYFGNVTIAVDDEEGHQTQIIGGNLSAASSASNTFGISNVSSVAGATCGATNLCLTATVAAPDLNINSVYDPFEILTSHFGLIPFYETGWNSSTNVISLQAYSPWLYTNYGGFSYWYNNDIVSELNAATTLFASERLESRQGRWFRH